MTDVLRYAAFTVDSAGGNPAGVVLDAAGLTDSAMLQIAADVGYSESAFLVPQGSGRYAARYFSPKVEVAFCGHATVAAAVALGVPGDVVFGTAAGDIRIEVDGDRATLTSVATSSRPADPDDVAQALTALGWSADDLDPAYPVRWAFGGEGHLVLAVRDRARLAALDYDFAALHDVLLRNDAITAQLVHQRSADVFDSRNPFPVGGVVEDPATGAAAAAFGGYLRELGLAPSVREIVIRQGEDMGRPSELLVRIDPSEPGIKVSGTAAPIR